MGFLKTFSVVLPTVLSLQSLAATPTSGLSQKRLQGACKAVSISDFRLYALEYLNLKFSDVQGLAGAGLGSDIQNFLITGQNSSCLGFISGGETYIANSRIQNNVVALDRVTLLKTGIDGSVIAPPFERGSSGYESFQELQDTDRSVFDGLNHQALQWSDQILKAPLQKTVSCDDMKNLTVKGSVTVTMIADEFSSCPHISLKGTSKSRLAINVLGASVVSSHQTVKLRGMKPHQIIWNFPETKNLMINHTGDAAYGMPGTVLAPWASTQFTEGLITGSLIVKDLNTPDTTKTGQINSPDNPQERPLE